MSHENLTVPYSIIIKDEPSDEEEVHCRLCHKAFASSVALNNHARMDHTDVYENGDPTVWTKSQDEPILISRSGQKKDYRIVTQKQKQEMSQSSTDLTSLASTDVSYIIVKANESLLEEKNVKSKKKEKETKKRSRSPVVLTGPFECVEPSSTGVEGACHQMFFSCCEYSAHQRAEHARRRRGARCQVCERPLPLGTAAHPDRPYACEICGEAYASSEELVVHSSSAHVKLKPYECSICHKRFTQQGGVSQHMRMHSGERPFPCARCHKSFTQKAGLDQHMRTHTKVKPYRCVVCGKAFVQSVHLKQHMRTHTNLTPFQCAICDKRFKQSSHLNYHLKNHNPVTMTTDQRSKYNELVGKLRVERKDAEHRAGAGRAGGEEVVHYVVRGEPAEGYVEQEVYVEEVEQMEGDSYDVDPRDVCTVEQDSSAFANEVTYIIDGHYDEIQ